MENIKLKLSDLLIDIDYQKVSYEQRVDNFNKYGYSTSMKFFTPAFQLARYILSYFGFDDEKQYGYGHGKYVLDIKLLENATKMDPNAPFKYKRFDDDNPHIRNKEFLKVPTSIYGCNAVRIWLKRDESLDVNIDYRAGTNSFSISVPKVDIYQKIDEWLTHFGYKTDNTPIK